ncbi:MAG TPA: hypothetical protein VF698_09635, partial [Thermoanaerobaculia bacterium]
MRTYSLDFVNDTNDNWTMAVYQQLPDSVGLDSVSWLQTTAPAGGRSRVQFDLTNAVVLAEYSPDR